MWRLKMSSANSRKKELQSSAEGSNGRHRNFRDLHVLREYHLKKKLSFLLRFFLKLDFLRRLSEQDSLFFFHL